VLLNSLERAEEGIGMVESAMQLNPVTPAWYLHTLASSYSLTGRGSEAVDAYKSVLERNPSYEDAFIAHLGLAITHVELGQEEEGRTAASEILKMSPHFSVEVWGQRNPNRDRGRTERDMAALRKAGLL
jgi:tetratricopeptide (TPR) repeat protein